MLCPILHEREDELVRLAAILEASNSRNNIERVVCSRWPSSIISTGHRNKLFIFSHLVEPNGVQNLGEFANLSQGCRAWSYRKIELELPSETVELGYGDSGGESQMSLDLATGLQSAVKMTRRAVGKYMKRICRRVSKRPGEAA